MIIRSFALNNLQLLRCEVVIYLCHGSERIPHQIGLDVIFLIS
jgi:hypothetical protein